MLNVFLATGCRDQEIAHLEYSNLNFINNTVRIQKKNVFKWKPKSKAGTRNIPISGPAEGYLLRVVIVLRLSYK
jgi:integrase